MEMHEKFMQRCLQLAALGLGNVAPNPLVGAVLVHNEIIIGEGWHQKFGEAHAEVNCIQSVKPQHLHLIPESTLYVNLEPCNHYGKTPPCSLLIKQSKIKKVVVGSLDHHHLVSGKGIAALREASVEVIENVLEKECDELNKRFFTFHRAKRPFVIVKIAQSADGFMAPEGNRQQWLTNELSKRISHRWRTEEQAILVGKNTALIDNPQLTSRLWKGKNPLRVLIDRKNEVPLSNAIFNGEAQTLVFNETKTTKQAHIEWQHIKFNQNVVEQVLHQLYQRNIQSVIVEGGAHTAKSFIEASLVDEFRLITAPIMLEKGLITPAFSGLLKYECQLADDKVQIFRKA